MITITARVRPVYYAANEKRSGRRRGRLTKAAAYRDAAWAAWWQKYPCECGRDPASGYTEICAQHERDHANFNEGSPSGPLILNPDVTGPRWSVIVRLARWLRWRDTKSQWALDKKRPGLPCPNCSERVGLPSMTAKQARKHEGDPEAFRNHDDKDPIFFELDEGTCGACGRRCVVRVEDEDRAWLSEIGAS